MAQLLRRRSILSAAVAAVGVASLAPACSAPAAEPIRGDVASVIQTGFDQGTESFDHSAWNEILKAYAKNNGSRFDYAGLRKQDQAKFQAYLEALDSVELESLGRNELMAFFINAYNAYTVNTILERVQPDGTYDVSSIRDVSDVFNRSVHPVGGYTLSLNNIEHNILRPLFKDPRVHFAVNCASISCPPLPPEAFDAERLDSQLDRYTESTLKNADYVYVDDGTLHLTKILEWYGEDFVNPEFSGAESELTAYVRKYATDAVAQVIAEQNPTVAFLDYDWNLNKP